MANINVSGVLNSVAVDPTAEKAIVARAAQIWDAAKGKSQDEINQSMTPVTFSVSNGILTIST